jgi:hypothetical protein
MCVGAVRSKDKDPLKLSCQLERGGQVDHFQRVATSRLSRKALLLIQEGHAYRLTLQDENGKFQLVVGAVIEQAVQE